MLIIELVLIDMQTFEDRNLPISSTRAVRLSGLVAVFPSIHSLYVIVALMFSRPGGMPWSR